MRTLKVASKVAVALVVLVMLGGCCQEQERQVGILKLDNGELRKLLLDEQQKTAVLGERIVSFQNNGTKLGDVIVSKDQAIKILQDRVALLDSQLAAANKSYENLVKQIADRPAAGGGGALPVRVNRLLKALAANYPGLLTFDSASGQLRFSSDVTFDLGKDDLKANAAEAIKKLAMILVQNEEAKPIRVAVIGHTCTTRIAKAATKARFGDNQGLSEARAKAVGNLLTQGGVDAMRLNVSGVGSNQLLDKANPKSGRNRRVEIFLSMP
jgi:flagellar motor protein MotB